jgi:hypothetical protein
MSADTQITPKISDEEYRSIVKKHYSYLTEKPSKIEVEKNIAYNLANGVEAGEEKPRGTNRTPKKKKRKK